MGVASRRRAHEHMQRLFFQETLTGYRNQLKDQERKKGKGAHN
jgi:hypothetical protein